jgi:hypothetical protein
MIVKLHTQGLQTIEDVRAFVAGSQVVDFEIPAREDAHRFVAEVLRRFGYPRCRRADKGVLRAYLMTVTGLSRAQLSRWIRQFRETGRVRDRRDAPVKPFARRYTDADRRALADLDALHGQLSGPATRRLCQRAWEMFGETRYERLAGISTGHLYNLRHSLGYQRRRGHFEKTRPTGTPIAERRRPEPRGQPGFLRVDSVHQGDLDGGKGVYHINIVDAVTQYEFVGSVPRITEAFLLPLLEVLIHAFPFVVQGLHADNGSEYINYLVAAMLEKLRVTEFTKSRARQTTDNALVESKNAAIVRKHLGHGHIPAHFAEALDDFNQNVLSPYLNYHRPCLFATEHVDTKGKIRKTYPAHLIATPYEKLKSLPEATRYLKPGVDFDALDALAYRMSDNEAARQLNKARAELFQSINQTRASVA